MNRLIACVIAAGFATPAFAAGDKATDKKAENKPAAEGAAAEAAPMGPASRPVMHLADDKKGVDELYKACDDAWKAGDMNALADHIDFPVHMVTDNSKGQYMAVDWDRAAWIANMSKAMQNMPKDVKMTHSHKASFLSDALAVVVEENSMAMGKKKASWTGFSVVTNKDGKWLFKQMAEAGWGDTMAAPQGAMNAPAPGSMAAPAPGSAAAPTHH
jgi:hypothetical protein